MKKEYVSPVMSVVSLETQDIIMTSPGEEAKDITVNFGDFWGA